MKIEKITIEDFLRFSKDNEMTPSELSILCNILSKNNLSIPNTINIEACIQSLKVKHWIDSEGNPTKQCNISFFKDKTIDVENVEQYRALWPNVLLPSGKNAKSSLKEIEIRFKWFKENYEYDWNVIYKATEEYIKHYAEKQYQYMRTSAFFIYKDTSPKVRTSDLAEWCDKVTNGNTVHETFDIDI